MIILTSLKFGVHVNARRLLPVAFALLAMVACTGPRTAHTTHRSGLMEYLYPKREEAPVPNPAGARLQLPLRLGIAFAPAGAAGWRTNVVPATAERPLLDVIKNAFKDKPWVKEIKLIPSTYLTAGGGFDNLDQVCRLYDVSVVALVSVDQIQYTDPKWYSFAYLSILGAYILPGEANDTRTLIDAAVFDVPSRTFLLRAPGQSVLKGSTTLVNRDRRLREDSAKGLDLAMQDLAKNLENEVGTFKAEVAGGDRKGVDVLDAKGQSLQTTGGRNWGGAFGATEAMAGLALVGLGLRRKRR